MKWIARALLTALILPSALHAKGLDKLQPETEKPATEGDGKDADSKSKKIDKKGDGTVGEKEGEDKEDGDKDKAEAEKVVPKEPEVPVEPGFLKWYIGTSLSLLKTSASTGSWNSGTSGDIELGYKVLPQYLGKFDIYGTFRYRPSDVTVESKQRAYRGIVETYLFGAKGQMEIKPKLFAVASAEFGLAKVSLRPIDGIPQVEGELEKSGVDLTIGGGVSYLVLDKIAVGTQLHLGLGTYKSIQFGVDLRFLL